MSSAPPASAPPGTALRRSLGVVDGVALAASSTAATTSIAIGMGTIATIVGLQAPALLLLAFLPVLGIATAYARLNRSEPNMGNGYVWVGRSLGPWPGFLTGWVTLVGSVIFCAYTSAIMGSVVLILANKAGLHSVAADRPRPDVHRRHHRRRPGDPRRPHRPRRHRYPGRHPLPVRPPGLRVRGPAGFLRLGPDHRRPRLLAVLVQPLRDLQRQDLRPGHGPRGVLLLGLGRRLQRQRGDEEPGRGGPRRPHRPVRDARPVPLRLGRLPARDEPRRTRQERPPGAPVPRRETRRRTLGHPPRGRADVLRRRLRAGHPDPHRARTVRHEPRPHHGPAVDPHPPALRHPRHAAPPS